MDMDKEKDYIKIERENKKVVAFIIGGPNKYYKYSDKEIDYTFNKIKAIFTRDKYNDFMFSYGLIPLYCRIIIVLQPYNIYVYTIMLL